MAINLRNASLVKGLTDYANPNIADYSNLTSNWTQGIVDNMASGNINVPVNTSTMAQNAARFEQMQNEQNQAAQQSLRGMKARSDLTGISRAETGSTIGGDRSGTSYGAGGAKSDVRDIRENLRGKTLGTLIKFFLGDWAGAAAGAATGSQAVGAAVQGAIQGGAKGALTGGFNSIAPNNAAVQAGTTLLNGGLGNYLLQNGYNYANSGATNAGYNYNTNYGNRNYIGRNYLQNRNI